jgi:polysaccharide biosynthesis PFTS motif protein
MTQKIVFFEELSEAYDSIVNTYLKKGISVYYFKINDRYRKKNKIRKSLKSKKIVDISQIYFEYSLYKKAISYSLKNLDLIFEKFFLSTPSIEYLSKLLVFPKIMALYKKELLLFLVNIYEIELKINEILKNNTQQEIYFIPKKGFDIHIDNSSLINSNVQIINYTNFRIKIKEVFTRIFIDNLKSPKKGIIPLFYPVYLFFRKFKGISNNIKLQEFKVGITIPSSSRTIFSTNYLIETIIINPSELPKEQVLFIDENGRKNIAGYEKRGFNYTRLRDDREFISFDLFWNKILKCFFPVWFKIVILSLSKEPNFIDTKRRILQDYLLWNIFSESYKISNYVKVLLPDTSSKIHILSQYGAKTWLIYPDNGIADYHLDHEESLENDAIHSLCYYDNLIIYGDIVERWFKKHRNKFQKYVKTGVLYSQVVQEIQDGKLKSVLPRILKNKKMPNKIIGVFDTSYGDSTPLRKKDAIQFGNDMLKLLNEFQNLGIVFKAKKEFELNTFLISVYNKLKHHERCIFFARGDKEGISAPEVIAVSDLVISAIYTSPTAEALAARKKAIYYDASGKSIGDKYYYNRYPKFVAHNFKELKKLVNYWLYGVTDEEFNNFLNTYVKDEIDPYLDGKALSRLRNMLMEP